MQKVLLVGVAGASALQLGVTPMTSSRAAVRMPAVQMQAEQSIDAPMQTAESSMDMDATKVAPGERFKAISLNALDEWAERFPRLKPELRDIRLSSLIFPFKASPCAPRLPYLCNQLHARYASRSLLPRPGFVQTWSRS